MQPLLSFLLIQPLIECIYFPGGSHQVINVILFNQAI
jgi:hypothetical protein